MPKLTNTELTGLDFDAIKTALKDYLRGQTEFEDYDFEASGMSILLNTLAYNTHYQAYYLNMVANEMFLESAITRPAVVSAAKSLGFTPVSITAPTAELDLTLVRSSETATTVIEKYTPFTFTQSGSSFTFLVSEDASIDTDTNTATVTVKEGTKFEYSYIYDATNADQKFVIPDDSIDTSTINISVYDSSTSTTRTEYTLASDVSSLTGTSTVYFLAETSNGQYEIYFGDGTIGKALTNGNLIRIEAISTSGASANGAGSKETTTPLFTIGTTLSGWSSVTATVSSAATGGAAKQSIDQIRYLAPLFYESQDRAVTVRDYDSIVKQAYPTAESVLIYGGEDATPVQYGKVYVAIKTTDQTTLSNRVKEEIADLLTSKNIVTITPEVVDPDILYAKITTEVYFDPRITAKSSGTLLNEVVAEIEDFGTNTLEKFNRSLFHSKFVTMVDEVDTALVSNETDIQVYRRLTPQTLGLAASYNLNFNNEIFHPNDGYSEPVITSDAFVHYDTITQSNVTAYLEDDGNGNIRLYRLNSGSKVTINPSIGTIDYATGMFSIAGFTPESINSGNSYIKIFAQLASEDVISEQNTIISILPEDINVTIFERRDDATAPIAGY